MGLEARDGVLARVARGPRAALAGVLAAAALAALAGTARAGEIAFLRGDSSAPGGRVYAVGDHGGRARVLANVLARNLLWSPDGKYLAFTAVSGSSNLDVWLVRRDGSGLRRVTRGGASKLVTWARGRLVVARAQKLLVMSPSGKVLGRLRGNLTKADEIVWSPSGSRIALTTGGRLWNSSAHGKDAWPVTPARPGFVAANPSWSRDGRRLAFIVITQRPLGQSFVESTAIWTVDADGSHLRRLTGGNVLDAAPTWSPDGRRIAFMRSPVGTGPRSSVHADLWVVGADGRGLHRLTRSPAIDAQPAWRP